MTRIPLQNANNMPIQAPLIPDPFVPYECPGNRSLNAICEGDPAILRQYLENTPFTLAGDRFLVYVSDFTNCRKAPFMDAGIVIPVRVGDREGGYFLFEYEDNDAARNAGYATTWGEFFPGDLSVAAAVLDQTGRPVAAVNIGVSNARYTPEKAEETFAPLVVAATRSISQAASTF